VEELLLEELLLRLSDILLELQSFTYELELLEVLKLLLLEELLDNVKSPKHILLQLPACDNILCVHVIPSGDVAAIVEALSVTATNSPFPNAMAYQLAETGIACAAHVAPLAERAEP
jgi:hypothetical protein